ncbi:MAG: hypothetical protein KTR32_10820 [Granulosicoccus sp.]|nr:hypothetical protein [Granulosicoccus sp.]
MNKKVVLAIVCIVLAGCRGDDQSDTESFPATPNPDSFAQFLNKAPGVPADGVAEGEIHNVDDFPEAYYNTIDPFQTRNSFEKWRMANGFLNADGSEATCVLPGCVSTHVKFRDTKDLGYGRNMFLRWDRTTGDVAVYVENFQVDAIPGVPYGPLNLEALVNGDREWNFGVNAIEFSAYPYTGADARKFTKFYNFAGDGKRAFLASGAQQHIVDLDGRGLKSMPTPCIVCHGGHGRTLLVENQSGDLVVAPTLPGGTPGDFQANMQTIELNTLQFANEAGFTQQDNEDGIRLINEAILSTYEYRRDVMPQPGDWDPNFAIEILNGRYNGNPSATGASYNTSFIPSGWQTNPNAESIYNELVGPNCMVCHALRGSDLNRALSFSEFSGFLDFQDQIDHLTFERGLMPLGLLNYADFWESGNRNPALLAAAIGHPERIRPDNTAIPPGAAVPTLVAPLVVTGVNSAAGVSYDIPLSAGGSAFARGNYNWSVEPAGQAEIVVTDAAKGTATLQVTSPGTYMVTLTAGGVDSAPHTITVEDEPGQLPEGSAIRFYGNDDSDIYTLLTNNCTSCHANSGDAGIPIHYEPCDATNLAGGPEQGFDFLYRSVLARVNFESPLDSLIIRKPINGATDITQRLATGIDGYHAGNLALDSDAEISRLLLWILNGAPRGDLPPASQLTDNVASCL